MADESTSIIELRTMIPASAMKPIIAVVEGRAEKPVSAEDADEGQGDRRQGDERDLEEPNGATTRM